MRLTGPIAINDEQFGSIKENAVRNGAITVAIVVFILWLALRSGPLILALVINLLVGLAATAALGLMMLGAFNIISIYFAVLFVGIGVDFAIQFSVRYRDERHRLGDLQTAFRSAGSRVALPLALASLATAAGFFSFLPTDYKGVSELGLIAGVGMLVAFLTSMTLLPALIRLATRWASRKPSATLSLRRSTSFCKAQDADHRRDAGRRRLRVPGARSAQVRLQSGSPAESQQRSDLYES